MDCTHLINYNRLSFIVIKFFFKKLYDNKTNFVKADIVSFCILVSSEFNPLFIAGATNGTPGMLELEMLINPVTTLVDKLFESS